MIPIPISCISDFISPKANASEYTLIFSWRRISFRLRAASWIPVNPFGRSLTSLPLTTLSPFIFFFQRYNNCLDYIAFYIRTWRLETDFKIDRGVLKMLCTHRIFGDSVCLPAAYLPAAYLPTCLPACCVLPAYLPAAIRLCCLPAALRLFHVKQFPVSSKRQIPNAKIISITSQLTFQNFVAFVLQLCCVYVSLKRH